MRSGELSFIRTYFRFFLTIGRAIEAQRQPRRDSEQPQPGDPEDQCEQRRRVHLPCIQPPRRGKEQPRAPQSQMCVSRILEVGRTVNLIISFNRRSAAVRVRRPPQVRRSEGRQRERNVHAEGEPARKQVQVVVQQRGEGLRDQRLHGGPDGSHQHCVIRVSSKSEFPYYSFSKIVLYAVLRATSTTARCAASARTRWGSRSGPARSTSRQQVRMHNAITRLG